MTEGPVTVIAFKKLTKIKRFGTLETSQRLVADHAGFNDRAPAFAELGSHDLHDFGAFERAAADLGARPNSAIFFPPDITTQGGNVVVQLPGVKDRERALELVGSTAELRFRPVLQAYPNPDLLAKFLSSTTTVKGGSATSAPTSGRPRFSATEVRISAPPSQRTLRAATPLLAVQ